MSTGTAPEVRDPVVPWRLLEDGDGKALPGRDRGQLEGISHHTPNPIRPSEMTSNQF